MAEGKELFQHIHDQQGRYNVKLHIAEMIALLGALPAEVTHRYQNLREYSWPEPVRREDGKVCKTAEGYFCGPFFDTTGISRFLFSNESLTLTNISGRFLYEDLVPDGDLGDTVSCLVGEEGEGFLDLAGQMLQWHPDARKTAGELATHPFLQPKQARSGI